MVAPRFAPVEDVSAAAWLAEAVTGFEGRVRDVVPAGFPAYARILHRPDQGIPDATPGTWAEAAVRQGTVLHPAAQWEALVGAAQLGDGQVGMPEVGSLDRLTLARLRDVLLRHAGDVDCWFAVWPGRSRLPAAWETRPLFRLPMRQYHLVPASLGSVVELSAEIAVAGLEERAVEGGLDDQVRFAQRVRDDGELQSPQLWWPRDRSWVVATEIDFDSTIVAGSLELVESLLDGDGIEALRVSPDMSLQHDADTVNAPSR
jgi:hypothetical protein